MDTIKNIYSDLFQNPMGRISRGDYWLITIFQFTIWLVLVFTFDDSFLLVIPALYVVISGYIFQIKRYHDSGHKGWWILVPIANLIFLFYNSTEDNKWGPKLN